MQLASYGGNIDKIAILLNAGAHLHLQNKKGETAPMLAENDNAEGTLIDASSD